MANAKKGSRKEIVTNDRTANNMKLVTSQTCAVCKQQCQRGLDYLEKMTQPGAIGRGVPCILTKGKP